MDRHPLSLKWLPLLALTVLAAVPSVEAQPPATNAWKPIIFSSPDNDRISSNLTSLSTQPVPPANLQGGLFENTTPVPSFSFGPAPVPDTGRRFQKKSDDRSDWVLQTPAEIMGVAPDQILPSGKRDKDDHQDKLTPLERYLERQNYGSRSKLNPSRAQNSWRDESSQTNDDNYSPDYSPDQLNTGLSDLQSSASPSQPLSSVPSTVTANNWGANPNQDSVWANVLGNPFPPQSTPNPINSAQQQADMDQFRQMLNPGFTPVNTPTTVLGSANSFKPQINSPVSSSTQPLVNPIGASFAPLNSGIGQPAPLAQLPGITSQANTQSPLAPAWAPQPAPWTSPNPQPFAIPQRKF
jgi:hypothetical protein